VADVAIERVWTIRQHHDFVDTLLWQLIRRHGDIWCAGHTDPPLSSCFSAGWTVKPPLSKAVIRFRLISSRVILGVSLANTGLINFSVIIVLLFSGFGVMPGAQSRFQISPIH
jgi:hypothetical protein